MTDALVQFLRDRLDEDERTARATLWDGSGNEASWSLPASATVGVGSDMFYVNDRTVASHIARHDPARVLVEVDAKRRILAIHRRYVDEPGQACLGCAGGIAWDACPVIPLLALPYRDHPDYRKEWRP